MCRQGHFLRSSAVASPAERRSSRRGLALFSTTRLGNWFRLVISTTDADLSMDGPTLATPLVRAPTFVDRCSSPSVPDQRCTPGRNTDLDCCGPVPPFKGYAMWRTVSHTRRKMI